MSKIVTIGGGELSKGETYNIDKEIVRLSGKKEPKVLFVPTASFEPEGYCVRFRALYEGKLGGKVEVLYLLNNKLSEEQIEKKIKWADIIYVGGGDTIHMLKVWKEKKVDKFLKDAYERGTLLSGLSAGSICWFKYGQSEIDNKESEDGFDYVKIEGLGLINGFHCPHFNEGRRKEEFYKLIEESNEIGIAIDNNCAIALIDGEYRILSSEEGRKAYKVFLKDGEIIEEEIEKSEKFRRVSELGIKLL